MQLLWFGLCIAAVCSGLNLISNTPTGLFKDYYIRATGNLHPRNMQILDVHDGANTSIKEIASTFSDATITSMNVKSLNNTLPTKLFDAVILSYAFSQSDQSQTLVNCANLLHFEGCLSIFESDHDFSYWTSMSNRHLGRVGFVCIREHHASGCHQIMACRSRFEPMLVQNQLVQPQLRMKSKKGSMLLMLADLPVFVLRLFVAYSLLKIINDMMLNIGQ